MAVARTFSIALQGIVGEVVEIEVDLSDGLPSYTLLGLPDSALSESRERVRSAILNSGHPWPKQRITVSMSPAWLPKSGSHYDLPIAIAILMAQGLIPEAFDARGTIFMGELGLKGDLRRVRGILPSLLAATKAGFTRSILPATNRDEAEAIPDILHRSFNDLQSVLSFLLHDRYQEPDPMARPSHEQDLLDFTDVAGQGAAKFAAEIAVTGGHHLFLIGPPGTGKSMIAARIPTIMPELSPRDALEVSSIHSIASDRFYRDPQSRTPPFIAPHHSITQPALVGGGAHGVKPGAISLAHRGVLFIDEAPECKAGTLDSLREPLEKGEVAISRITGTISYPAKFLLVLAANPCPCGKFVGRGSSCTCPPSVIKRYGEKISGPLRDRIDIRTVVEAPTRAELASEDQPESSASIRARVAVAREIAQERYRGCEWRLNSDIPPTALRKRFSAKREAMAVLHRALDLQQISARGFHKILRVAWSIADLTGVDNPGIAEVEMALALRSGESR